MCKYCEDIEAIWLKKRNIFVGTIGEYDEDKGKRLAAIFDVEGDNFFKMKPYLSVAVNEEKNDWFDVRINYCPFCGRKLKRKSLTNVIKAIIEYKQYKKEQNK